MQYIERKQEKSLKHFLSDRKPGRNVLLIEGARQVGKTTLIERCLSNVNVPVVSINFELQKRIRLRIDACSEFDDFILVLKDECGFNPEMPGVLFIDESQESERLGGFVRFMKERLPYTWTILSGSTLTRLFRNSQRFPVGRVSRMLVTPFDFAEFLRAEKKEFLEKNLDRPDLISDAGHESLCAAYNRYLLVGGLPAVVSAYVENGKWESVRKEIAADYDDDLKRIFGEETIPVVRSCLRAVSSLAGSSFKNTSVIASPSSGQNDTINYILSRLEDWKLVLKSEQQGLNPVQSYRYHPKRYLFDTGIIRDMRESAVPSLTLLGSSDPVVRTALGGVIENQVAIDLSRRGEILAGWKKSSSGTEIDFIIKDGSTTYPVECKATVKIKKSHTIGIENYLKIYNLYKGAMISLAPFGRIEQANNITVLNIPLYCAGYYREIILSM